MITAFIKAQAIETAESVIVAESLNYLKAQFVFITSDWNGLEKTAYFTQGQTSHPAKLDENNITVDYLHLGEGEWAVSVVGREYANGELVERITTDTETIKVKPFKAGAETPFPEPTPTEIEALKAEMGNLPDLATSDKTSLVNAINEVYRKGGSGAGESGADGFSPIVDISEIEGGHRVTITDAEGTKSFDVLDGEKGDPYTLTDADKEEIKNAVLDEIPEIPTKTSQLENDAGFITGDDIPEIPESDFSRFIEETTASVNLYPPTTEGWTNSAMVQSSGAIATNTKNNMYVTPQIAIEPSTTYTISGVFGWAGTTLSDVNKGRAYSADGVALAVLTFTENADGSYTFTTPENASYVYLTGYKAGLSTNVAPIETIIELFNNRFMLVKGAELPTIFEPYGKGSYRLKDIEIPLKSVNLENIGEKGLPIFAPLAGKKIANFGDSIFGNARPPEDVSTYLAEKTGAEVLNCAFGGCRMAIHNQLGHWNAFTMVNLAQAIASGDYSVQDEALNYDDRTSYAEQPLSVIKATDFSTVDILTIAYGTNDFTSNIPLDNAENSYDTATLAGALRTSIESLLTAYPNLRIFILSLTYRFYVDDNNEYTEDSNTRTNGNNVTIPEFNAKLKEVAEEYNLPFVDDYNIGIGKHNRSHYFNANDGAHHKETGRKLIAEHLAKELY